MLESYSNNAKRYVVNAFAEAAKTGSPNTGTEHLLLSLAASANTPVWETLRNLRFHHSTVLLAMRSMFPPADPIEISQVTTFTDEAKEAVDGAMREMIKLDSARLIGPEHLLLSLAANPDFTSARILKMDNVGYDEVRLELRRQLGSKPVEDDMTLYGVDPHAQELLKLAMRTARSSRRRLDVEDIIVASRRLGLIEE